MPALTTRAWGGDYFFLLQNLMQKDFRIRYRNMSLGMFWSLLNPLVTMAVLTFVFTNFFPAPRPHYPIFLLCGIVPFNFFTFAWGVGTNTIIENGSFVKRVAVPREVFPIASVLSNCLHLGIQIALLLTLVVIFGEPANRHWVWLPLIWLLYIVFVCGLTLITSALNVFVRDVRYLVESFNAVLFWLVPIVYGFESIPQRFVPLYSYNPVAAVILALRKVLLENSRPENSTMLKLAAVSLFSLVAGLLVFRATRKSFYDYL